MPFHSVAFATQGGHFRTKVGASLSLQRCGERALRDPRGPTQCNLVLQADTLCQLWHNCALFCPRAF